MAWVIYWRNRIAANGVLAFTTAILLVFAERLGLPTIFDGKPAVFQKGCELVLTVSTSLLGFLIAAIALIFTMIQSNQLSLLKKSKAFSDLVDLSSSSVFWLILSAVLGASGVLMSLEDVNATCLLVFRTIIIFAVIEAFLATASITWVLIKLIRIG